jgi:hypothetical protein
MAKEPERQYRDGDRGDKGKVEKSTPSPKPQPKPDDRSKRGD